MLTLPELLHLPNVDNGLPFSISTDKKQVVFSWNKTGTWELWEHKDDISKQIEISLQGAKFSPRFSPDGTKIAFALDLNGSESYHIAIHDLTTNTSTDLTPDILYAHQPNVAWSPDSKALAVLSDAKGQFSLYVLPLDGGEAKMIRNIFHPCWDVAWSPNGLWIAVESEAAASDRSIHIVPVGKRKGPRIDTVQLKMGGMTLNAQHPAWSPDSRSLAFSCENGEWHNIGLYDVETQQIEWVTDSEGDDFQPVWSQSGEILGWVHHQGPMTSFQFKKRGGELRQIKVGDGLHSFPQFIFDEVILLYEDVNHPADLWKMDLESDKAAQLTKSLDVELNFPQPKEVWYKSRDGVQVPAILYRGDGKRAVINIHGGPNWHFSNIWHPLMSYMASLGWTVLGPNYRGSTGYGRKWQNASRYDMGGIDTDDCAEGAKYLIENGFAEKDKVAVTGRSHGGFLTMCCLVFYPHLFTGGSAVVPFLNWFSSHKNSREDLQHWNIENMGDPREERELWVSHSPYFFLSRIEAPVQMVCGANDPRCPASESIKAHEKLKRLGKQSELHLYEDEGHVFLKIENVIDAEVKQVEFLRKVLDDGR